MCGWTDGLIILDKIRESIFSCLPTYTHAVYLLKNIKVIWGTLPLSVVLIRQTTRTHRLAQSRYLHLYGYLHMAPDNHIWGWIRHTNYSHPLTRFLEGNFDPSSKPRPWHQVPTGKAPVTVSLRAKDVKFEQKISSAAFLICPPLSACLPRASQRRSLNVLGHKARVFNELYRQITRFPRPNHLFIQSWIVNQRKGVSASRRLCKQERKLNETVVKRENNEKSTSKRSPLNY